MPKTHLSDVRFDSFDLDPRILAGLADAGFTQCTPIQAEALPIALAGRDVAGQAQTGTGKTAAFLVAALHRLLSVESEKQPEDAASAATGRPQRPRQPRVVILAPTRELAVQIHKDALVLAGHTDFRLGLVYGGTGYQSQRDALAAGVDILIGTPGRLIDYFKQRVFDLQSVEVVVLDEADRMFDLGFIKDIRFVLRRMPPPEQRLGMLFSATLSYRVTELAYEHMNHPQMVEIAPEQITADRVQQSCYMVANDEKVPLLIGLLRRLENARVMVFVNTKRAGEYVWGFLEGNGLRAAMLSGDVPQRKRLKLLKEFTDGDLPIMVATDVAARGLHIPGVTHVINFDLPEDAQDYVHRIGRTARAGEAGDAISFVCETHAFCLPDIEAYLGIKLPVEPVQTELLAKIDLRSRVRVPRRPKDGRGEGRDGRWERGRPPRAGGPSSESRRPRSDNQTDHGARATADRRAGEGEPRASSASADTAPAAAPKKRRRRRRGQGSQVSEPQA
jgi:ATP-dependent RNA helicase RhlB